MSMSIGLFCNKHQILNYDAALICSRAISWISLEMGLLNEGSVMMRIQLGWSSVREDLNRTFSDGAWGLVKEEAETLRYTL